MPRILYKIKCMNAGFHYLTEGYYESVDEFLKEHPWMAGKGRLRWVRDLSSKRVEAA